MKIGDLARGAEYPVETIRCYEREGLPAETSPDGRHLPR